MFCLKELRLENGMKRSELARLTGIHQNTLSNYENGSRQAPYETLVLLADFFSVSVDELLGRERVEHPREAILTAGEKRLLARFRALGAEDRERVLDYFSVLERGRE